MGVYNALLCSIVSNEINLLIEDITIKWWLKLELIIFDASTLLIRINVIAKWCIIRQNTIHSVNNMWVCSL